MRSSPQENESAIFAFSFSKSLAKHWSDILTAQFLAFMAARTWNSTCGNCTDCSCATDQQFHERFQNVVPNVYAGGSILSVIGCLLVFITYCRLRRLSGYLPKALVVR